MIHIGHCVLDTKLEESLLWVGESQMVYCYYYFTTSFYYIATQPEPCKLNRWQNVSNRFFFFFFSIPLASGEKVAYPVSVWICPVDLSEESADWINWLPQPRTLVHSRLVLTGCGLYRGCYKSCHTIGAVQLTAPCIRPLASQLAIQQAYQGNFVKNTASPLHSDIKSQGMTARFSLILANQLRRHRLNYGIFSNIPTWRNP